MFTSYLNITIYNYFLQYNATYKIYVVGSVLSLFQEIFPFLQLNIDHAIALCAQGMYVQNLRESEGLIVYPLFLSIEGDGI